MSVPDWYSLLLLGVATWRTFQLIAFDTLLDKWRDKLFRLDEKWEKDGDPLGDEYRIGLATWLQCPYCAGFWIGVAWFTAWQITGKWTELAAVLFVLGTFAVAGHKTLSREEDRI